jgi:hypothetical protein
MNVYERARSLGLDPTGLCETEVVHWLQIKEGNQPCYCRAEKCGQRAVCCFAVGCKIIHHYEVI